MAEWRLPEIPESYRNLVYDIEPISGPSAPIEDQIAGLSVNSIDNPTRRVVERQIPRIKVYSSPPLVFEEIYEACIQYAKQHGFGTSFVNRMKLKKIDSRFAFHYKLENYGEKRETVTEYSPYKGESSDGELAFMESWNESTPNPWDIKVQYPTDFKERSKKLEIPHTTNFENCSRCRGSSTESCTKCLGSGTRPCWLCDGKGKHDGFFPCIQCGSTAELSCLICNGSKKINCRKCNGIGKIKETTFLMVTWQKHPYEFVSDTGSLPRDLIKKAKGEVLLEEKSEKLLPIIECPDLTVNDASASLLQKGKIDFPDERILYQRHVLQVIPFTKVIYSWNDKEGDFHVYGKERQVYFETYPQNYSSCTCF